jgi:hypothetical protein
MITSKVLGIGRELAAKLPTRGGISLLEQKRIFEHVSVAKGEHRLPQSRGEVAAQEKIKIVQQVANHKGMQSKEPRTRGEVAIQEQMKIFGQLLAKSDTISED